MAWRINRLLGRVLAGAALVAAVATAAPSRADVDPLLVDRARSEISAGHVSAGFAIIENAIRNSGTPLVMRADLLNEAARLWVEQGGYANAGDALARRAAVMLRLQGPKAPELAAAYGGVADAYGKAGEWAKALGFARDALGIDTLYFNCETDVIADDHRRIAAILDQLGDSAAAVEERRLADAPIALRCADERAGIARGPVVVTNDVSDVDERAFTRVKVFYATDRARSGSDRPNEFYGGERGSMEYGTVEVTIPREHKPGGIEAPSLVKLEWNENPERHVVLTRIATASEDAMLADLRLTLAGRKSDEAFVFVHGFNVTFADAAKRTAQIYYDINFDGAPIMFSWPSAGSAFSYIRDEAVVRLSGRRLLAFLDDLIARSGAKKINLIAHSMGNRALLDALELMAARREGARETGPVFDQIIFAAPDEDAALFTEMVNEIRPLANRLTLYGSNSDVALQLSNRVHGDLPRAGQAGDGIVVSHNLDSVDMSVLGDDMLAHSYFASTRTALADVLQLFWRDAPPGRRCGMDLKPGAEGEHWHFDPSRCDGPVMLSALTLLRNEGKAALDRLSQFIAVPTRPEDAGRVEEWRKIRDALVVLSAPAR